MLAIDWAHTKLFAVCNARTAELLPWPKVIEKAKAEKGAVIEAGAPLAYLYRLARAVPTYTVPGHVVAAERERRGHEKTDLNDARLIYAIAERAGGGLDSNDSFVSFSAPGPDGERGPGAGFDDADSLCTGSGAGPLRGPLQLEDDVLRLVYLYRQYLYTLKAKVASHNLYKAMRRHFGEASNATLFMLEQHDGEFEHRCASLQREIQRLAPEPPGQFIGLKGISKWLWAGIVICADPRLFDSKGAYRVYCGLTKRKDSGHRFSRNASRIYYLCADQLMRQRTPGWREIYDTAKEELAGREGYSHPHGGAMNRLMTAFANFVYDTVKEAGVAQQAVAFEGGRQAASVCVTASTGVPLAAPAERRRKCKPR